MNVRSIAFAAAALATSVAASAPAFAQQQAGFGGCTEQVVQERQQQVADAISKKQAQDPKAGMVLKQQADEVTAWYHSTNTADRFGACAKYDAIIKSAQM